MRTIQTPTLRLLRSLSFKMAFNGVAAQSLAPVLAAVEAMQSSGNRAQKAEANESLDRFQKTVGSLGMRLLVTILKVNRPTHGRPRSTSCKPTTQLRMPKPRCLRQSHLRARYRPMNSLIMDFSEPPRLYTISISCPESHSQNFEIKSSDSSCTIGEDRNQFGHN